MSADEEKVEEVATRTLKEKCVKCLRGPNILKTLVIATCVGVVVQQITVCMKKLINVPITTYTHFDFNKTVVYPSVTFCREPPYKYDKMLEYGLYGHPRYTSTWNNFNFSRISLDQLWDEITYTERDMFVQFGLQGWSDNINISSTMGFVYGRCFTLNPTVVGTRASKTAGYSVTLQHRAEDVENSISVLPPGYHVYVHYSKEDHTEVEVYNGGLGNHIHVNVGETVEVKLTVDEYLKISKKDDPCTNEPHYSANSCTAKYVSDLVGDQVGCSGPWMDSDLPRCDNATAMTKLISTYINTYEDHSCDICPRFCRSYLYNTYVTDRQDLYTWDSSNRQWYMRTGAAALQTQLYIYFEGMMVSVYEERHNYDWNLFIADLGGSVGFLLGLSVIGLLTMFEKAWALMVKPFIKTPKPKREDSISDSTATVDVKNVANDTIDTKWRLSY